MPPLRQGVAADELESAFVRLMQERVFGPVGMATARLGDDPRPYTADYATGYAPDLVEEVAAEPWVPIGSTAPGGGVLASLTAPALGGRAVRVLAMPDGSYVGASGQLAGSPTLFVRDHTGTPVLELEGETVRWLRGPS